ncbi:MAG: hypothetical protein EHM32_11925, partial [Spirochaetales bacterium]
GRIRDSASSRDRAHVRRLLDNTKGQEDRKKQIGELAVHLSHLVDITNNINEAICVIDRNHSIEVGFNKRFSDVFGERDYSGKSIFDTIFANLWGNSANETKEFLDLCFASTATEDAMLNDVNPIARFNYIYRANGNEREKILKSTVVRIKNLSGSVEHMMLIFDDVTIEERSDHEMKIREKAFEDELSIMTLIFRNDKDMIIDFINSLNDVIERIQEKYQDIDQDTENRKIMHDIQGMVHLIKGESFALGFDEIAGAARNFESYIKTVADEVIVLETNLNIIEFYENLYSRIDRINTIAQRLFSIGEGTQKLGKDLVMIDTHKYDDFKRSFQDLLNRHSENRLTVAELLQFQKSIEQLNWINLGSLKKELQLISEKSVIKDNKRAIVNFIYDVVGMPEAKYRILKETLVHLVRNSIAHGIEDSDGRKAREKDEAGRINIHISQEEGTYKVLYSDDGAGFNLDKIRQRAIANNLVSGEKAALLTATELIGYTFKSGFSTYDSIDMVAGVGIGMSVVKNNIIHSLNGAMKIRNQPEKGISISMSFQ